MSTTTTRSLAKTPRPSLKQGLKSAVSTPNLNAAFAKFESPFTTTPDGRLVRKVSANALTSDSLASIPDVSKGYALSKVLGQDSTNTDNMPQSDVEVDVGDIVDVPGNMYGTVKFIGSVHGKKGIFAGVELGEEFAERGKNNGDVDGRSYFTTNIPGAGIFLPIGRAIKKRASPARTPMTPGNSRLGASMNRGFTPPTPSLTGKFSQSVGPGRAPSPQRLLQKQKAAIPRPESPIRRPQTAAAGLRRPSLGGPQNKARYAPSPTPPTPTSFAQSVRGTQDSRDPMKKFGLAARASPTKATPRSASALSQQHRSNYSDDELTPVGMARHPTNDSMGSVTSFSSKLRPNKAMEEEVERLKREVEERDRQLREQAASLAEMESSLQEVHALMGGSMDDKDVTQLRHELREKKEKIAMLTAEFDAHRADFRSTIDTLELASTETERVYEAKVQELLAEIREYQDRSEDVDSVARQLKQLEELVQELEEGLEDARRGEAEARGEVEFLRGEVERGRSELKRERDKSAAMSNGDNSNLAKEIMQRDDEIRGLKAIIHSLSRDGNLDAASNGDARMPAQGPRGRNSFETADSRMKLEKELGELRSMLENKNRREEELERELEQLRRSGATVSSSTPMRSQRSSNNTITDATPRAGSRAGGHNATHRLDTMQESDDQSQSSTTDATESWCQMCETKGHDILNCPALGNKQTPVGERDDSLNHTARHLAPVHNPPHHEPNDYADTNHPDAFRLQPAPLSPLKKSFNVGGPPPTSTPPAPEPANNDNRDTYTPPRLLPNPLETGPVAGKESGVIDENKWCALCERDGHDSVDCPLEDAF